LLIQGWRKLLIENEPAKALADLDENSGLKVEDLRAVLVRLDITPKARTAGYGPEERALLFDPLGDSAEPQFPHFLRSIANAALKKSVTWDLDRAKEEWFWGYCWEGSKVADVFKDWMALLSDMGLVQETGTGENIRDKRYEPVALPALSGLRQEAENWLNKDLAPIIVRLSDVFGEGKVMDMFAPKAYPKPGTKVNRAAQLLDNAKLLLTQTKTLEDNYDAEKADDTAQITTLRTNCRNRLKVRDLVAWVFVKEGFEALDLDSNLKTINFENDDLPLWERIGKADKLATYFKEQRSKMTDRAESLQTILTDEAKGIAGFPTAVFVRQLERIKSVLAAAEKPASASSSVGETTSAQYTTPGTLAFLLKDLKAQQAIEKLEQLAVELGYDPATSSVKQLGEVDGHIVSTFLELRKLLNSMQVHLTQFNAEAHEHFLQIADAPPDYIYPNIPAPKDLSGRAAAIAEEFELVQDDLEDILNRHSSSAQLGHFQPLMLDIKKAYFAKEGLVGVYRGQVTTLANSIVDYRQKLVQKSQVNRIQEALNPLRIVKKLPTWPDFGPNDIEAAPTLKAATAMVADLEQSRETEGATILAGSGASFDRWKIIYAALKDDADPGLSNDEERALLTGGFLRKKLVVGS
jgi:hypothetical protein